MRSLAPHARYHHLLNLPDKEDIAKAIRQAMARIEVTKPELAGVLPQEEYDRFTRSDKNRHIPKDLLKTEGLSQDDEQGVKLAAKHLLRRLVEEQPKVLVQDWYLDAQTQTKVRSEISRVLNDDLPATYDRALFKQKCTRVYGLVTEFSARGRKWAA